MVKSTSPPLRGPRTPKHAGVARALAKGVFVALVLRAFVVEAYVIPSESMTPTLQVGDRVFADKFTFGLSVPLCEVKLTDGRLPRRGEVVIFTHPRDGTRLIKRIVGRPGDRVALRAGRLLVNGRAVPRRRLAASCAAAAGTSSPRYIPSGCVAYEERLGAQRFVTFDADGYAARDFGPVRVPAGHLFVLGDNRPMSSDSRFWGSVPRTHLKGRAHGLLWSYSRDDGARWSRWARRL